MSKSNAMSVYIGRFQPPHLAHIETIKHALEITDEVLILIGSSFKPSDPKNPFTHSEREKMIRACFDEKQLARLHFAYISDNPYNELAWIKDVQEAVDSTYNSVFGWQDRSNITIIGRHKDESSYYLDIFPNYKQHEMETVHALDSTTIRELYFAGEDEWKNGDRKRVTHFVPEAIIKYLNTYMLASPNYSRIVKEAEFIRLYKLQWANVPYPPTFVTADAVVVNMGNILLVQRKAAPGQGLWALPGGFIRQFETVEDAALRELKEETKIKVPDRVLQGSITREKRYDYPHRSLRGRTVTTAFLIQLRDKELPKVKGSDDAAKAKWFRMNEFVRMQNQMYEDHYHIVTDLLGLG